MLNSINSAHKIFIKYYFENSHYFLYLQLFEIWFNKSATLTTNLEISFISIPLDEVFKEESLKSYLMKGWEAKNS